MRTKKAIYNNIASMSLQFIMLLISLVVPRIIIKTYGSEVNGLISSLKQFIVYINYIEAGMTASIIYLLFRPLAKFDNELVGSLVSKSRKEYYRVTFFYLIAVLIFSAVYPLFLNNSLKYVYILLIVLTLGLYGVLDFFTMAKYRSLLTADQRSYVISLTTILTLICHTTLTLILLHFNVDIVLVLAIPSVFLALRTFILKLYIKKRYSKIDYKKPIYSKKIDNRSSAFIMHFSTGFNLSITILLVTFLVPLDVVSVFSVYNLIFLGVSAILTTLTNSMQASFGNVIAKNEKQTLYKANNKYEFVMFMIIAVVYSAMLILVIPFVSVYTKGITDIDYIRVLLVVLFVVWGIINNSRITYTTIISASGNWKMVKNINIIQTSLLFVFSLGFGLLWGLNGVLLGMILSTTYKSLSMMITVNKKVLVIKNRFSLFRLIRTFLIVGISYIPFYFQIFIVKANNYLEWGLNGVLVFVWVLVVTIIVNLVFEFETVKNLVKDIVSRSKRKRVKKDDNDMLSLK